MTLKSTRKKTHRSPAVKIKTVSFRSCVQLQPFQHAHIEVTAEVQVGQSPEGVLDALKCWVADELKTVRDGKEVSRVVVEREGRFRDQLRP